MGKVRRCAAARLSGYTLVEVMVATGLLTSMLVALYAAFSFGFATIKLSQEDLRADHILVQKLEALRMYDWSKVTGGYIPTNSVSSFSSDGGTDYNVSISIQPAPVTQSYSNSLRQVTVSLSWISGKVTRTRAMTTLVSDNGLQTYKP
jgi:hypothetical protein